MKSAGKCRPYGRPHGRVLTTLTLIMFAALTLQAGAHPTYIGYSGAPGCRGHCSQSCHPTHDYAPSVTVTGFPANYTPGQQYTIAVAHQSGAAIANFNCSVRSFTDSSIAGVLAAGTNTATYSQTFETNGIHWSTINTDSGDFIWTAPDAGVGQVCLYWAGLQGTPSNGADTQVVLISDEAVTGVNDEPQMPDMISLSQNYPNPFNSETIIEFAISNAGSAKFEIDNILGQQVYSLEKHLDGPGTYSFNWNGKNAEGIDLPSGVYFYRLRTDKGTYARKMTLLR